MVGKILPYVAIGYVQMTLDPAGRRGWSSACRIVRLARRCSTRWRSLFIAANLALGLFFSTLAKTQQQAMQMSFFFLLPNILLSRLHVPVRGACRGRRSVLSQALPLTHFLRIVRGITLKGAGFADVRRRAGRRWPASWSCW